MKKKADRVREEPAEYGAAPKARPSSLLDTRVIYSDDALTEVDRFFREDHAVIVPLTVREILDEHIARKLA